MKDIKVLFIGNSHTYMHDMPHLFSHIYEKTTGCRAEVTMLAFSGRKLSWHLEEFLPLRFALMYGGFDYCVIQQGAHPFPPVEDTLRDGARMAALCSSQGVMPVFYMTWAEKRMPENQQKAIDTYKKLHADSPSMLAPVGIVWRAVREKHPEIELYSTDGEHASPQGDLLVASVLTATLTGSPEVAAPDYMQDFKTKERNEYGFDQVMNREDVKIPLDGEALRAIHEAIRENWAEFAQ